jgi:hypothetical protein
MLSKLELFSSELFQLFFDLLNESGQLPHAPAVSERRIFMMGASVSAFAKFIK